MKKTINIPSLSRLATYILKIGLPLISLVFVYIFLLLSTAPNGDKMLLYSNGYIMLEEAVMSFTLIFCGAFLADIVAKNN